MAFRVCSSAAHSTSRSLTSRAPAASLKSAALLHLDIQLELLEASLGTLMTIFRAAVRLHGERAPSDYEALSRQVGALAGFDAAPFVRVVRHVRGAERLAPAAAEEVLSRTWRRWRRSWRTSTPWVR